MSKTKDFDLESLYDAEIAPLMTKIIDICKANRLPMFATFLYASTDSESSFVSTNLPFSDRPVPPEMLALEPTIYKLPLHLRVRNADGQITKEVVIMP
jgi:hypothetical protein